MKPKQENSKSRIEKEKPDKSVADGSDNKMYILKLYIAGSTARSNNAIANIKKICEEHLKGQYELTVIDLYQQPALAEGEQIIALPTLIKKLPPPLNRVIGDLSNTEKVLVGLDLRKVDKG